MPTTTSIRYADDVTQADAEAALAFLRPRLDALMEGGSSSPSFKPAFALEGLARDAASTIRFTLERLASDFYTSEDRLQRLHCRMQVMDAWNRLYAALWPWRQDDGFDPRWQHINHFDAQAEERYAAVDVKARAKLAAKRSAAEQTDEEQS